MRLHGLPFLLVCLFAVPACRNNPKDTGSCFLELRRELPGRLILQKPVDCSQEVSRYRLEGTRERPLKVDHLDPRGENRLSYQVRYDAQGRPQSEERLYKLEPATFKLYGGRTKLEYTERAPGKWEVTRFVTEMDEAGRPTMVRKYVGADLEYSVVSEYRNGRLVSRSTYDGHKHLMNRMEVFSRDGKPFERMLGPDGKVLMEREVEKKKPEPEQALDSSGPRPVHSPLPND